MGEREVCVVEERSSLVVNVGTHDDRQVRRKERSVRGESHPVDVVARRRDGDPQPWRSSRSSRRGGLAAGRCSRRERSSRA